MTEDDYQIELICPVCGNEFDIWNSRVPTDSLPCCSHECEEKWPKICQSEAKIRESEINYRGGYDYACGYHD